MPGPCAGRSPRTSVFFPRGRAPTRPLSAPPSPRGDSPPSLPPLDPIRPSARPPLGPPRAPPVPCSPRDLPDARSVPAPRGRARLSRPSPNLFLPTPRIRPPPTLVLRASATPPCVVSGPTTPSKASRTRTPKDLPPPPSQPKILPLLPQGSLRTPSRSHSFPGLDLFCPSGYCGPHPNFILPHPLLRLCPNRRPFSKHGPPITTHTREHHTRTRHTRTNHIH